MCMAHPCPWWTSGQLHLSSSCPPWQRACELPHRPCGLFPGVSQLAKMLLPLAESLIMVLETPTWLFPALVSASKWCVWDLCHNHFPSHFPLLFSFENHHAGDSLKSHTSTYEEGKRIKILMVSTRCAKSFAYVKMHQKNSEDPMSACMCVCLCTE